jgi:hypothetical protein
MRRGWKDQERRDELSLCVGLSHGLWPWKYLREGGAINR